MRIVFSLVVCCFILSACSKLDGIKPEVSFLNGNLLLPQVKFDTPDSAELAIIYWPTERPDRKQESHVSNGTHHEIVLLNLKPSTSYNYFIYDKSSDSRSSSFDFKTYDLPSEITLTVKQTIDTTQFKGFVLVRGLSPIGADVIIDNEGDVVWYHQYDTTVRRPFSWSDHNTILSVYDSAHIVEVDLKGRKKLNLKLDEMGIGYKVHHDVIFNKSGSIVTLTHDSVKMDLRKFGGRKDQYLRADGILVLSQAGKIEWTWNLLQVLDPFKLDPKSVEITQTLGHANSIALDSDGHYLVSFRDFSQIWKINSKDGSVIWKLGAEGDFKMDPDDYFIRQHSAFVDAAGDLMLFDNGDRKNRPYSRILSFSIDEATMMAKTKVNIKLNKEISADKMCSAEEIENGKFLVCTSKRDGIISIVDLSGNVLWRVNLTRPSYRAYYLKDPFHIK